MKLFAGILLALSILYACKKTGNPDVPSNPGGVVVVTDDFLSFPLLKGNYWKYQRIDSAFAHIPSKDTLLTVDTTEEMITVMGDTLIPAIHAVNRLAILQVKNLTKNKLDTNFILYTKDFFALYGHPVSQTSSTYTGLAGVILPVPVAGTSWGRIIKITLPVSNSLFNMEALRTSYLYLDSVYTRKDTVLSVSGNSYSSVVYVNSVNYSISFAASGSGGYSFENKFYCKPAIGILYQRQTPIMVQGSAFNNVYFKNWFTRRLISYKLF